MPIEKMHTVSNNLLLVNRIDETENHNDGARSAVKVAGEKPEMISGAYLSV